MVGGGVMVCVRDGAGQTMLGIFVAVARVPVQLVVGTLVTVTVTTGTPVLYQGFRNRWVPVKNMRVPGQSSTGTVKRS